MSEQILVVLLAGREVGQIRRRRGRLTFAVALLRRGSGGQTEGSTSRALARRGRRTRDSFFLSAYVDMSMMSPNVYLRWHL